MQAFNQRPGAERISFFREKPWGKRIITPRALEGKSHSTLTHSRKRALATRPGTPGFPVRCSASHDRSPQLQCWCRFKFPLPSPSEPQLLGGQRSPKSRAPRRGLRFPEELRYDLGEGPEAAG